MRLFKKTQPKPFELYVDHKLVDAFTTCEEAVEAMEQVPLDDGSICTVDKRIGNRRFNEASRFSGGMSLDALAAAGLPINPALLGQDKRVGQPGLNQAHLPGRPTS